MIYRTIVGATVRRSARMAVGRQPQQALSLSHLQTRIQTLHTNNQPPRLNAPSTEPTNAAAENVLPSASVTPSSSQPLPLPIGPYLPLRLRRLIASSSSGVDAPADAPPLKEAARPTFVNGKWRKAQISGRDKGRIRRNVLFAGGALAWQQTGLEKVNLRSIEPVVLKGRKWEKRKVERAAAIAAALETMDARIEEHHANERARRKKPTFYQLITGKKPEGVVRAEEEALKAKKEKAKLAKLLAGKP